ncbi:uncharacterized protein LOC122258425 [Penaeus japonicus]|nr:uncharacterized protein LOC122258425 [Penaeus japonicus]
MDADKYCCLKTRRQTELESYPSKTFFKTLFHLLDKMILVGVFLGLMLVCHAPPSEARCSPSCTGMPDGSRVPDPNNCHYYYICLNDGTGVNPTPVSFPCPDGEDFDSFTHTCRNPGSANFQCDESCFPCRYYCDEKSIIADPWQCGTYYHCTDNVPSQGLLCPDEKPFFDGDTCQADESRCCSCISYCSKADMKRLVADVHDCTGFYYCDKVGPAEEKFHSKCPLGNFDVMHQRCSETLSCFSPCQQQALD